MMPFSSTTFTFFIGDLDDFDDFLTHVGTNELILLIFNFTYQREAITVQFSFSVTIKKRLKNLKMKEYYNKVNERIK